MNRMAKTGVVAFLFTMSAAMGVWALVLGAARPDAKHDGATHLPAQIVNSSLKVDELNIAYREAGEEGSAGGPNLSLDGGHFAVEDNLDFISAHIHSFYHELVAPKA